jgi:signal transduction histidine kinase
MERRLRRSTDVVERWMGDPRTPMLVTDRRTLRQVVSNLVGNARKCTAHLRRRLRRPDRVSRRRRRPGRA